MMPRGFVHPLVPIGMILNDRYRIDQEIGQGGKAQVFRATDLVLGRVVAVKALRSDLLTGEEQLRLERECRILALLNHPHVCKIYQMGRLQDGAPYLAMEYISGTTLRSWINTNGRMKPELAFKMAFALCDALSYAHDRGIVHRDLNPNNIMLANSNPLHPKIIDFGIAKLSSINDKNITITGNLMGTPHYMSPEQFQTALVDGRSDIYSVGCTLYETLTGQRVFDAEVAAGLAWQHLNETATPPSKITDVPDGTDSLIGRALSKLPAARYPTAISMARDIQLILKGQGDAITIVGNSGNKAKTIRTGHALIAMSAIFLLTLHQLVVGDPGAIGITARVVVLPSQSAENALLTALAKACHTLQKPIAEAEIWRQMLVNANLAKGNPDVLDILRSITLLLIPTSFNPDFRFKPSPLSSVTADYLGRVASMLDEQKSGKLPHNFPSDLVLSSHLKLIQNATYLCGSDLSSLEVSLRQALSAVQNREDLPLSRRLIAELNLYLAGKYKDDGGRMNALLTSATANSVGENYEMSRAYLMEGLAILDRIKPAKDYLSIRHEFIKLLWRTDYATGYLLHGIAVGRQRLQSFNNTDSEAEKIAAKLTLCQALCFVGMHKECIELLEPAVAKFTDKDMPHVVREYLCVLSKSYLALNKPESASRWYQRSLPSIRIDWIPPVIDLQTGRSTDGMKRLTDWRKRIRKTEPRLYVMAMEEVCKFLIVCRKFKECKELCENTAADEISSELRLRLAQCEFHFGNVQQAEFLCTQAINSSLFEASQLEAYLLMTRLQIAKGDRYGAMKFAKLAMPLSLLKSGRDSAETKYINSFITGKVGHRE